MINDCFDNFLIQNWVNNFIAKYNTTDQVMYKLIVKKYITLILQLSFYLI